MSEPFRLAAVCGPSVRMRDEALSTLTATWEGPRRRLVEPDDLPSVLLDLATPSLFGDSTLSVVRADMPFVRRHADALTAHVGQPRTAGVMILVCPDLDQRSALAKALGKAGCLHVADVPDAKGLQGWLAARLMAHPQGVDNAGQLAASLIEHVGTDLDALLSAIDLLAIYVDDGPLSRGGAEALFRSTAERPIWDFTGAVLEGKAGRAIELLHAAGGEAEPSLAALINEIRRQIACCETQDDDQANAWVGGRGNLYHARRRARELGRAALLRLLIGAIGCQRQLRTTGSEPLLALEIFVLHAQRVLTRG